MKCGNCGNEFEGKFCPECGMSAEAANQNCVANIKGEINTQNCRPAVVEWVIDHKRGLVIGASVMVALITVIVFICVLTSILSNVFRIGMVSKIEIGYTQVQVERILGEPFEDESTDTKWIFYSNKYMDIIDKINALDEKYEKAETVSELEKLM